MTSPHATRRACLLLLLLFAGALLAAGPATAATGLPAGNGSWTWQAPTPQGHTLNDISFVSADEGWIVGDWGTVLHTTDAGATWQARSSGLLVDLCCVQFTDATHGWALGHDRNETGWPEGWKHGTTLLRTSDGGVTWTQSPIPLGVTESTCLAAEGTQDVWLGASGTVLHSADGGSTWTAQDLMYGAGALTFTDATHGWAASATHIACTTDGGGDWNAVALPTGILAISAFSFVDDLHGWAVGTTGNNASTTYGGIVLSTSDGGLHWSTIAATDAPLKDVRFVGSGEGWVCTGPFNHDSVPGKVLHTTDNGSTWSEETQDTGGYIAMDFASGTTGLVVGASGQMRRTTDGGGHWTRIGADPLQAGLLTGVVDVAMAGGGGWAVSHYGPLARTTNGGVTWLPQSAIPALSTPTSVASTDTLHAWVGDAWRHIARTSDGGATWQTVTVPDLAYGNLAVTSLRFLTSLDGWAVVGENPSYLVHTVDGGATWQTVRQGNGGGGATDDDHLWLGTGNGVASSSDGGATWHTTTFGTSSDYYRIRFGDARHGIACADSSGAYAVWRTGDGGDTWTKVAFTGLTPPLGRPVWEIEDLEFGGPTSVWLTVPGGLLHSGDCGKTWQIQETGLQWPDVVGFLDPNHGWVLDSVNGGIVATTNGGAVDTEAPTTTAPDLDGTWRNDATVELLGVDALSGVARTDYQVDGGSWASGESVTLAEGEHTINYHSTDNSGNLETPDKSGTTKIDLTKPHTDATGFDSAWHNAPVTITLTAGDNLAGVKATHSTVAGTAAPDGTSVTVPAPTDGSKDGVRTVTYWSEDTAGNVEDAHSGDVKIDTQAPTTRNDATGAYLHAETVMNLTAEDAGCGVGGTFYKFDDALLYQSGTTVTIPAPADHSFDGDHTLWYYSVDAVGNAEAPQQVTIHVDTSATPDITSAGATTLNRPTAAWTLPAGWTATDVEVCRAADVTSEGPFPTRVCGDGLVPGATSWEALTTMVPALQPGSYCLHLRLYNETWQEYRWTAVHTFTIAKTARPKQYPTVVRVRVVGTPGNYNIKLRVPVKVSDDSKGPILISFRERRYVNSKVKGENTRTWIKPGPRTYGTGAHTYVLTFTRANSCRGKGVYEVMTRVQDLEYNWSNALYVRGKIPF